MTKRTFLLLFFLGLLVSTTLLSNWTLLIKPALAASLNPLPGAPASMTFQQFLQEGQPSKAYHGPFRRPIPDRGALPASTTSSAPKSAQGKPLPSVEPPTMHALTYLLDSSFVLHRPTMKQSSLPPKVQGTPIPAGTTPFQIKGSDGRLEVDLSRASLDFAHAALAGGSAPVGQLFLQITQVSGHYIGEDNELGIYQFQFLDSQGSVFQGVQLTTPVTLVYHYQPWEMQDLTLNPNDIHLSWPGLIAAALQAHTSQTGLVIPMSNNPATHTLTAQTNVLSGPLDASGTPEIQTPATPDLFAASGNSGQYSYSYPIAVAPGPGGFAPQLQLTYSSQSTNERYDRRAPAGDAGEGFTLTLGSISSAQYPASSTGGAATWYFLNDVAGVSDRLVPSTTAGFYETQHMSHLRIKFTGSIWQVWDLNGAYYEFGETPDSVRKTSAGTYEWDLNKVLAPYDSTSQVKTMLISYLQDSPSSGVVRDAAIKQITYGYATNNGANPTLSLVSGTVDFHYHMPTATLPPGQGAFATGYGTNANYNCASAPPASTSLRCDDPAQFGSIVPPDVMSTMTLDAITSYVGSDSTGHPAYKYTFTYQDLPYVTNYWTPYSLTQESAAGEHLLTAITPMAYVGGTAFPRKNIVFNYSPSALPDHYTDPNHPTVDPSQQYGGQTFWNYLVHYQDLQTGVGANITYATAHGNATGTPDTTDSNGNVTDDRFDPFYCNLHSCAAPYGNPDVFSWSLQVVTQIAALGTDSSAKAITVATTTYNYALTGTTDTTHAPPVSSCHPITGSNVPSQEADCVMDNWVSGRTGLTPPTDGDWMDYYHAEFRGFNIVYTTSAAGDLTVDYYLTTQGWWWPAADGDNYEGGQRYQEDVYQGDDATSSALLRETIAYYLNTDVPGVNPYNHLNGCNGLENPVYTPCVVAPLLTKTTNFEGQGGSSSAPWVQTVDTYDDVNTTNGYIGTSTTYHNLLNQVITTSDGQTLTRKWTYQATNGTFNNILYYDVNKASHSELDDGSGHVWQCQDTTYDEGRASGTPGPSVGLPTTVSASTDCSNATATALKGYTGYDQYGNVVATVDAVGASNAGFYSNSGCQLTSAPVRLAASWTAGRYTSCTTYDTSQTAGLPLSVTNALGQSSSTVYDYTSAARPSSTKDANGQTTGSSYSFDSNGNETISISAPGESGSYTTRQGEQTSCTSSSTLPCYEVDSTTSLYSSAVTETFYDSQGRAVETRTPGPGAGHDTIVTTVYNDQNHTMAQSVPFQVNSGSGWIDPNGAKDYNGNVPGHTVMFYDALGRTIAVQDPNYGSTQEPGIACSTTLSGTYTSCTNYALGTVTGDTTTYASTTAVDPNQHVAIAYTDALGRTVYSIQDSGVYGGTLTPVERIQTRYNALNKPTSVIVTDLAPQTGQSITSVTTTTSYDDQGRVTSLADPDRGTHTYTYDADGHVLSDVSGTRTVGSNYDLLGRVGCIQDAMPAANATGACSAGHPLVQNTYDTTKLGTQGSTDFPVGHLTQSIATTYYPEGTSATVTEQFQYDQRGRSVTEQMALGLPSTWGVTTALPVSQMAVSYNDANQPVTTTTSTNPSGQGYTSTLAYDSTGALAGLSNTTSTTPNLATLLYNVHGGLDTIQFLSSTGGPLANDQFGYDANLRPTSTSVTWQGGSGQSGSILSQARTYDNTGNVISLTTTEAAVTGQSGSGGSETQNFCYNEQDQLVWAGNSGTQPGAGSGVCGSGTLGSGFSGASYTNGYVYTHLGQLWQGPLNGGNTQEQYLYCNSSHPHQLTGLYPVGTTCSNLSGAVYTSSDDAWGNVTSRMFSGATATLSYDILDHFTEWNAGTNNQEWYVYDASGQRVLRRFTTSSGTTIITYPFGLEEHQYSGTGANGWNTYYYTLGGRLIGSLDGNGTRSYLTDGLGSVLSNITNAAGGASVKGDQVFGPYGKGRYYFGDINTAKGFTGQYTDGTGLDYYGARYYDPKVGMFLTADTAQGNMAGMDPYAYVGGNPETNTDPSGRYIIGANGQTYYPGSPYYTQGGEAYSISTGLPYNTGGYVNGWRPTQGSNAPRPPRKHLVPGAQLDNWCFHDSKCIEAVGGYFEGLQTASDENSSMLLMAFFEFMGGDPEAFAQAAEENVNVWEVLARQEHMNVDDEVSAKLASLDSADQVEGEAGAIAQIYSRLIRFNQKFGPNGSLGEVDAETPEAIIEAKDGGLKGRIGDIRDQFENRLINPNGKPFVIYAPNWNERNVQTAYEQLGSLDTGQDLYITTSPEQLIEVLTYLQEGAPAP